MQQVESAQKDGESKAKSCMTCATSLGKCSAKVECCPSRFPKFSSNFHMGLSENRVSSFRWAFWGYTQCSDSQITILSLMSHNIYIYPCITVFSYFSCLNHPFLMINLPVDERRSSFRSSRCALIRAVRAAERSWLSK